MGTRVICRTALPPREKQGSLRRGAPRDSPRDEIFLERQETGGADAYAKWAAETLFNPVDREYLQEAHLAQKATEARSRSARERIRGCVDARRRYRPPRGWRTHQSLQREVFPAPLWPRSDRIVLSRKDQTDPVKRILVVR